MHVSILTVKDFIQRCLFITERNEKNAWRQKTDFLSVIIMCKAKSCPETIVKNTPWVAPCALSAAFTKKLESAIAPKVLEFFTSQV